MKEEKLNLGVDDRQYDSSGLWTLTNIVIEQVVWKFVHIQCILHTYIYIIVWVCVENEQKIENDSIVHV